MYFDRMFVSFSIYDNTSVARLLFWRKKMRISEVEKIGNKTQFPEIYEHDNTDVNRDFL